LTIAGTGEAGAIVTVAIDGVARNSVVDNSGNWQVRFDPAQIGNDGAHSAVVTLTDAAGNRSTPTGQSYVVQTLSQVLQVGGDGPPNTINAAERAAGFTVQGLGPEGSPAGTAVTVSLSGGGGSASQTVSTGAGGNWAARFLAADNLPDGNYTVSAFGTIGGVAGEPSAPRSALIDTMPPAAPSVGPVSGDNRVAPGESGVVITGQAEAGSSVAVSINNSPLAVAVAADGAWTAAVPVQLLQAAGARQVAATATDAVGNTGPQGQVLFLVVPVSAAGEGQDGRLTTQALQPEQLLSDPGLGSTGVTSVASSLASIATPSPLSTLIDDPNQANLA
jgi:hypothetical protein